MRKLTTVLLLAAGTLAGATWGAAPELPRAPFLGVQAAPVDDAARARLNVQGPGGALVVALVDGGSAKAAGLRADDVITSVDDHPIADPGQLVARLLEHRAGDR